MVIFEIVCCHGNSLQHTHINVKEIPIVLLIFTVNAKAEAKSSLLVLHPSSGVRTLKTVGSHLMIIKEWEAKKCNRGVLFTEVDQNFQDNRHDLLVRIQFS